MSTEITPDIDLTRFDPVVNAIKDGARCVVVIGEAGTGKSTCLRHLRNSASGTVLTFAPTNVTARNIDGRTLHSYYKINPFAHPRLQQYHNMLMLAKPKDPDIPPANELMLVDEIGRVPPALLDTVAEKNYAGGPFQLPFRAKTCVFFGDPAQLPPIENTRNAQLSYFWDSEAFRWMDTHKLVRYIILRDPQRQEDAEFVAHLRAVRMGEARVGKAAAQDAAKYFNEHALEGKGIKMRLQHDEFQKVLMEEVLPRVEKRTDLMIICGRRATRMKINGFYLSRLEGDVVKFPAKYTGDLDRQTLNRDGTHSKTRFAELERERKRELADAGLEGVLELKLGAKVRLTINDRRRGFINGDLGLVEYIPTPGNLHDNLVVKVRGNSISVPPTTHSGRKGTITQYPARLGYAETVHSAQGLTLPSILVLSGRHEMFSEGSLYTALTRVRKPEDIILTRRIYPNSFLPNLTALRWIDELEKRAENAAPTGV